MGVRCDDIAYQIRTTNHKPATQNKLVAWITAISFGLIRLMSCMFNLENGIAPNEKGGSMDKHKVTITPGLLYSG